MTNSYDFNSVIPASVLPSSSGSLTDILRTEFEVFVRVYANLYQFFLQDQATGPNRTIDHLNTKRGATTTSCTSHAIYLVEIGRM